MQTILAHLDGVKKTGKGYLARCPAHDDRNPSLSISQADDGRILLYCHAGCSLNDICSALGIRPGDLFPDSKPMSKGERMKYQVFKKKRKAERGFDEIRRRAFISMVEFRDLTRSIYEASDPFDMSDELVKAVHMLPMLQYYIDTLCTKTSNEQLELLRGGILTKWARMRNSQNPI
jgi:hypothetical protein